MPLHPLVVPKDTTKGGYKMKGLFATGPIPKGTVVWWEDLKVDVITIYSRQEILEHPKSETLRTYSYMVGPDQYSSTTDPSIDDSWLFNHACADAATCWYDGDGRVVTKRDVAAGEELAYDYGLTETEASFHAGMQCGCGAKGCRGLLTFGQYRDPVFMAEHAGRTTDYITRKSRELGWHLPCIYQGRIPDDPAPAPAAAPVPAGAAAAAAALNPDHAADGASQGASASPTTSASPSSDDEAALPSSGSTVSASNGAHGDSGSSHEAEAHEAEMSYGLFTLEFIPKGTVLLYFGGKVVGKETFIAEQKLRPTPHFLQVGQALWMVPTLDGAETADYINHSCDPNCGMMDSITVVALRDIPAGEQLCLDYAMVMDETLDDTGLESFSCCCGSALCRGRVTPRDYLIPELQAKYWGFFTPFLRAKLPANPPALPPAAPAAAAQSGAKGVAGKSVLPPACEDIEKLKAKVQGTHLGAEPVATPCARAD